MITVKAPGKLYIAGEYAVVETGQPAVIVALNQFVTVRVEAAHGMGRIESKQYQENSLYWRRQGDEMVFDNRDNPFHYILSAIRFTEAYASEQGKPLRLFNLYVDSDLDSADGRKFGLGSSAAVTVGTVKALCQFYNLPLSQERIYKLAAIAHLDIQGNGSLGDIAASVFGGWIAYCSFDREWLHAQRNLSTLSNLLAMPWPGLDIELLTPPDNLRLLIGWTGSPASTSHLVDQIKAATSRSQTEYHRFLAASRVVVTKLVQGFRDGDLQAIKDQIGRNRFLLQQLSHISHVHIETPKLMNMCNLAIHAGGAAKTSGAGGGDCGIVILDRSVNPDPLIAAWHKIGVQHLPLSVHLIEPQTVSQLREAH
ncbi:MAG: phosphomevalonate kinase [Schleiferilactobacillus perolens]|uniref:phosphomevalonate kinase n=1 Tax=Schleiferilactobacillus perolens TaxID=100468 RepID=UPI0039E75DAA|nr:phosphomevalonate kinase [Schleiferilactobacillus harbinensis]MCI1913964.1 phosphomevalonate kinase [Schleiferilactobacillus harbinensis]